MREFTVRSPTLLESFIWWTILVPDRRTENRSTGRQGDRVPLLENFVRSQPDKGQGVGGRGCVAVLQDITLLTHFKLAHIGLSFVL